MQDEEVKARLHVIGQSAYSRPETLRHTFDMATYCLASDLTGDFVECGVGAGSQVGAMALACEYHGRRRLIHLYDSFQGIPIAGERDDQQPGIGPKLKGCPPGALISTGVASHSMPDVYGNLKYWGFSFDYFLAHVGWFQDTVPKDKPDAISLLRLDGDLYESTKVCLEGLYPLLCTHGVLIVDDYALKGCREAVHEYFGDNLPNFFEVKGGGGPVWSVKS